MHVNVRIITELVDQGNSIVSTLLLGHLVMTDFIFNLNPLYFYRWLKKYPKKALEAGTHPLHTIPAVLASAPLWTR